ncbi:MAG: hypothetical protein B6I22_10580 [Desulfobacteraceae bacterium 4572_123]|nr:MAG: hypothetical protein B6I22_10580 [Desulfobacteraceae bacterium 4572_123]
MCDAQAGYESLLSAFPSALAGANLIYGTGMVDSGMTLDYGKMVIDDEINQTIKYVVKGFEVNDETLSVGLIEEIAHTGNHLSHSTTFHHCSDLMAPQLMSRENYDQWMAKGGIDVYERALGKARDVVENHQPPSIGRQAQKEIDEIIRETEKELGIINAF